MREKVETARTDAIQNFKTSQSFIDSCADYYSIGFNDYLKQVALAFLELDLSGISMDAPEPVTRTRNVVADDDDGIPKSQPPPKVDGSVILAQPVITPPAPVSKTLVVIVDADGT